MQNNCTLALIIVNCYAWITNLSKLHRAYFLEDFVCWWMASSSWRNPWKWVLFGESPNHCYATFSLETPYVTLQGFSEMNHLTGPDFQRIKSLFSSRFLDFLACELLEYSGNSVFFASFDQDGCGVISLVSKDWLHTYLSVVGNFYFCTNRCCNSFMWSYSRNSCAQTDCIRKLVIVASSIGASGFFFVLFTSAFLGKDYFIVLLFLGNVRQLDVKFISMQLL